MEEIFKPIELYEHYLISNRGRIWSSISEKFLNTGPTKDEHRRVELHKNGEYQRFLVHRLVLKTFFIGPLFPDHTYGCHNNGNRFDNRIENLRWDTHVGNMSDKLLHGTASKKLSIDDILTIRKRYMEEKISIKELSEIYNVGHSTMSSIIHHGHWKTISEPIPEHIRKTTYMGERSPRHKLKEEDVITIRQLYANGGITQKEIGKKYGVCKGTIQAIIARTHWSHI